MSATRDKSQKTTFVYTNLYQLYRKGKDAAIQAEVPGSSAAVEQKSFVEIPKAARNSGAVLKTNDLREPSVTTAKAAPRIEAYKAPEFIAKRIVSKEETALSDVERNLALAPASDTAIQSLKQNLKTLNDLHARLRFMLQELEELVKG